MSLSDMGYQSVGLLKRFHIMFRGSDIIAMTDEPYARGKVSHYQVWIEFLTLETFQNDFSTEIQLVASYSSNNNSSKIPRSIVQRFPRESFTFFNCAIWANIWTHQVSFLYIINLMRFQIVIMQRIEGVLARTVESSEITQTLWELAFLFDFTF